MSAILAQPITFPHSGVTAPNRFLKSAMTERLASFDESGDLDKRGKVTDEYLELYRVWGAGEIGTIVLGNIPIHREGLEAKKNLIIDSHMSWDPVESLKPVVKACKAHGMIVIGQLTHGGRQTSTDITPTPVSSSDVQAPDAMGMKFGKPRSLNEAEIDDLVDRWAFGAETLYKAGADGCQLHAAHGYLLSQFLSSRVNQRKDSYGGPLENKARIVFRVIEEIKKRVPEKGFLIAIKINSADFSDGGFTGDESKILCQQLDEAGVDLIELSGGTYESNGFAHKKESTKKRESFFIEFAEEIRPTLKKAVLAVTGGFRTKKAMETAIDEGSCQIIGMARPLCAEPYLCRDILSGKSEGALPNKVPESLQTPTAIMQLGAISTGKAIPDLSDEKVAQDLVDIVTGKKKAEGGEEKEKASKPNGDQNVASYEKGGQGQENGSAK